MSTEVMFVRLKPYNGKKNKVKRYHYKGMLYAHHNETGRPIAYKIDDPKLLDELEELNQVDTDPDSGSLFDIFTEKKYGKITKREDDLRLVELGLAHDVAVEPVVGTPVVDRRGEGRAAAIPVADVDVPGPLVEELPPEVKEVGEATAGPVAPDPPPGTAVPVEKDQPKRRGRPKATK
jgi:hypothetical protein